MAQRFHFILFLSTISLLSSCAKDKFEPLEVACPQFDVTYERHIKEILDRSCAYAGCHDGNRTEDFTNYVSMQTELNNGKFYEEVILSLSMPPNYATDGPTTLTQEEYELVRCWAETGYLEE